MKSIDDYMALQYVTKIVPDEDMEGHRCYRAEHPELPGCMSHGKTPAEAVQNLSDATRLYIQTRIELNLDIPAPAVSTTGTTSSPTQSIVLAPVGYDIFLVPEIPYDQGGVETNLPTIYDPLAEKSAA